MFLREANKATTANLFQLRQKDIQFSINSNVSYKRPKVWAFPAFRWGFPLSFSHMETHKSVFYWQRWLINHKKVMFRQLTSIIAQSIIARKLTDQPNVPVIPPGGLPSSTNSSNIASIEYQQKCLGNQATVINYFLACLGNDLEITTTLRTTLHYCVKTVMMANTIQPVADCCDIQSMYRLVTGSWQVQSHHTSDMVHVAT